MPMSDWDVYTTADVSFTLYTTAPIDGAGSCRVYKGPVGYNRDGAMLRNVVGERDKLSGAIQAAWKSLAGLEAGSNDLYTGVVFLVQQTGDLTTSGKAFYLAGYHTNGNGGAGAWGLWRFNAGTGGNPIQVHEGPSTPAVALDTPFTLDVEWQQDPVELDGVRVIVKVGTALDYSDLTPVFDVTENSATALMGPSYGEGFALCKVDLSSTIEFLIDKIRAYDVSLA